MVVLLTNKIVEIVFLVGNLRPLIVVVGQRIDQHVSYTINQII